MKKISLLLDDVTVINFRLLGSLVLRYKKVSFLICLMLLGFVTYFYLIQPEIHQKKSFFKVFHHEVAQSANNKNFLQQITETRGMQLKEEDVEAIVTSYSFVKDMVKRLVDSKNIKKFNFESPVSPNVPFEKEYQRCKDEACRSKLLPRLLAPLYSVSVEPGTGRMILTVMTKNSQTTIEIIDSFHKVLEDTRMKHATDVLDKEITQVQSLASKTRSEIELKGGFERIAKSEFLNATIEQRKNEVQNLFLRLSKESELYNFQKISLKESNKAANAETQNLEMLSFESYSKINQKINELRQNIASIKTIPDVMRTTTDNEILIELAEELKLNEKELKKLGNNTKIIGAQGTFLNKQINGQSSIAFDHKVSSQQLKKLQSDTDIAKKELDGLYIQKMKLENEFLALKPDMEYLKLIESRLVTMRLKKTAISSEVNFEPYDLGVHIFKENSLMQIFVFSFVGLVFLLFLSLVFIFLCDDRIFDVNEIERYYKDLHIIGHAPRFDAE